MISIAVLGYGTVGSGSVYLGVWGEGLTGSVSIQIE